MKLFVLARTCVDFVHLLFVSEHGEEGFEEVSVDETKGS
jgi:hypothetical protein